MSKIKSLASKDYYKKIIHLAEKQNEWITTALIDIPTEEPCEVYQDNQERRKLITPFFLTDEEFVQQWESVVYTGKGFDDTYPEIYTEKGERVRSKSEKIIADKLYRMGIPYRYEYPLRMKGHKTIYPDFTLLNTSKRKEIILEHFGKMDDSQYINHNVLEKLPLYEMNGYVLGDNMIISYESSEKPLNTRLLEQKIKQYLEKV